MSATWGELLDDAEHRLLACTETLRTPFTEAAHAETAIDGHGQVLSAVRANLRSLDIARPGHAKDDTAAPALADALTPHWPAPSASPFKTSGWHRAAECLRAAAETLASHIGPDRSYRHPDAILLSDPAAVEQGVTRLVHLTGRVADVQRHLALRVHELAAVHTRSESGARWLDEWSRDALDHATVLTATAAYQRERLSVASTRELDGLQAVPLLHPTVPDDPITAVRQAFDNVRVIAHRQVRGELPAGIDGLGIYMDVGALATAHAHAITGAASTLHNGADANQLRATSSAFNADRQAWLTGRAALAGAASLGRSPRLLHHEADVIRSGLSRLTMDEYGAWLSSRAMLGDEAHAERLLGLAGHLARRLPDLGRSATAVFDHLHRTGQLVGPTRERDDLDHPYRWAPLSALRRDNSRAALAATARATTPISGLFDHQRVPARGVRMNTPPPARHPARATSEHLARRIAL